MNFERFGNRCLDPMTLAAVAVGASAFSAVSSVMGGIAQNKAAAQEAELQRRQGQIALEEAQANAKNEAYNQTQFVQRQRLAFLANGVTLEGSPTAVLKQSKEYGQSQVDAIIKQGKSQYELAYRGANITQSKGRAALVGGITSGISTGVQSAYSAYQSGMFDPTKTTSKRTILAGNL